MEMPRIWKYAGDNTEATAVEVGGRTFFFSYQTCVAFKGRDGVTIASVNVWSKTTGRHLGAIGAAEALPNEEFEARLRAELENN